MENLCEQIPGARPIMVNTDGGEIIIHRKYEQQYYDICKKWEELTKLELEFVNYEKIIIPDVNNYIGINEGKKITKEEAIELLQEFPKPLIKRNKAGEFFHYPIKVKGRFEVDKPLHKNKSYRIKRLAYYNYFAHGISPEKTLESNKNIFDYCAGARAKGRFRFKTLGIEDGEALEKIQQKTIRYYVAKKGYKIFKYDNVEGKQRIIKLEAEKCYEIIMNKYDPEIPFEEYNLDIQFYLRQIRKELNNIVPTQTQQLLML